MVTAPSPDGAFHGTFRVPQIARIHAPAGVTGTGTLIGTPAGLVIDATHTPQGVVSAAGWLGFFAGILVQLAVWRLLASFVASPLPWTVFPLLGPIVAMHFARRRAVPKPLQITVPWRKIAGATVFPHYVSFRSKVAPRGAVHFFPATTADAQVLGAALRSFGLSVRESTTMGEDF